MTHLIGKKRKFGNDTFTAQASKKKKTDAEKYAENKRKQGFKARVVVAKHPKKGKEYYIFLKKGNAKKKPKKKTAKQKHRYAEVPHRSRFSGKWRIEDRTQTHLPDTNINMSDDEMLDVLRTTKRHVDPHVYEGAYRSKPKKKPVKRKPVKRKSKK